MQQGHPYHLYGDQTTFADEANQHKNIEAEKLEARFMYISFSNLQIDLA